MKRMTVGPYLYLELKPGGGSRAGVNAEGKKIVLRQLERVVAIRAEHGWGALTSPEVALLLLAVENDAKEASDADTREG